MKIQELYQIFLKSDGISTDTRKIQANQLFFALKGENFNGNKFAENALERGTSFAVIDEPEFAFSEKYILVDNVLETLQKLANFHLHSLNKAVFAITGSNGKTSTKNLIHSIFSHSHTVFSTPGNFNNHIGLPLSVLQIKNEEFIFLEMGDNAPGEIDFLCKIAEPKYALVTNIGKDHLEGFGDLEGVKITKKELYDFIEMNEGAAFVNESDPNIVEISKNCSKKVTYGLQNSDYSAKTLKSDFGLLEVEILDNQNKHKFVVQSSLTGEHNVENILAASAVALYFGISVDDIQAGIKCYKPQNNRSQIIEKSEKIIYLDAYNANPSSVIPALETLQKLQKDREICIILGEMLELGRFSEKEHRNLAKYVNQFPNLNFIAVGQEMRVCFNEISTKNKVFVEKVDELADKIANLCTSSEIIFIKGSRANHLEKVIDFL